MGVLTAICVDVKDAPPDVKIRHVARAILNAEGEVVSTVIDTPEADYCWLVVVGGQKQWISGDHHLPCISGTPKDDDKVVGTLSKINPQTGEVRYGPAEIRQSQYDAWIKAGAIVAVVAVIEAER
jgi:hypothetical protein